MMVLKLALRNVLAHRRRSLVTAAVVGLAVFVVFLFMGFSDAEMQNAQKGFLALLSPAADLAVYPRGLKAAEDEGEEWERVSSLSLKGYPALLAEIRALPFVRRAGTPTTPLYLSVFAGGQKYRDFLFRGVDPEADWIVHDYVRMVQGSFFDADPAVREEPQVILHWRTAATMKIQPGATVTIVGKDLFGQEVVQQALLAGFYEPLQDMPYLVDHAFLNKAGYDLVSGLSPDETMSLFVDLKPSVSRGAALARLREWAPQRSTAAEPGAAAEPGDLEFWDFKDLPRNTFGVYELLRLVFMAASLLIVGVTSLGIMSVVSVNLFDRKREIGTYYCLGTEKHTLIALYTLEIVAVNLGAALAGVLLGLVVREGVNALRLTTQDAGFQLLAGGSSITLGVSAGTILFIFASIAALTGLTALSTLRARLRVPPIAALQEKE